MGRKAEQLLENMIAVAHQNGGLAIMETWKCPACREWTFYYHGMSEVICCGNCGHRVASGLPRYHVMCEAVADSK